MRWASNSRMRHLITKVRKTTSKYGLMLSTKNTETVAFGGRDPVRSNTVINNRRTNKHVQLRVMRTVVWRGKTRDGCFTDNEDHQPRSESPQSTEADRTADTARQQYPPYWRADARWRDKTNAESQQRSWRSWGKPQNARCEILGFHRGWTEFFRLLGYYAA